MYTNLFSGEYPVAKRRKIGILFLEKHPIQFQNIIIGSVIITSRQGYNYTS